MSRTIILPREIEKRLGELTKLKEETNGILLYRAAGELCPVEAVYITGVGSEGHVQSDQSKIEVVNKFFELNPDYLFIKFHTHTTGTTEKYGAQYAHKFSAGDIAGIKEQLRQDKRFIAMLITQETTLLSGLDNPQLRVVEQSDVYEINHEKLQIALKRVEQSLGMENTRFKGTKIR